MTGPAILVTAATGLQDLAGLLTLIGAPQCAHHVSSALTDGMVYATASPLSTFGCPSIVLVGLMALIASFSERQKSVRGPKFLQNAGFNPVGKDLGMIMLDPDQPTRYLAESRLEKLLEQIRPTGLRIDKLSFQPSRDEWVCTMFSGAAASALLSILPFVVLILDSSNANSFDEPHRWILPIMKLVGAFLTVTSSQILIRQRILQILAARLHFMILSETRQSELQKLRMLKTTNGRPLWDPLAMSESTLSLLYDRLLALNSRDSESLVAVHTARVKSAFRRYPPGLRSRKRQRQSEVIESVPLLYLQHEVESGHRQTSSRITLWPYQAMDVVGSVLTLVGFLGCFALAQTSGAPWWCSMTWLLLDVFLALARIWRWGRKKSKVSTSIELRTPLKSRAPSFLRSLPLSTDVMNGKPLPLIPNTEFLPETIAYAGMFPPYAPSPSFSVYYTVTRNQQTEEMVLYITIHDEALSTTYIYGQDDVTRKGLRYWPATTPTTTENDELFTTLRSEGAYLSGTAECDADSTLSIHYFGIVKALKFRKMNPGAHEVTVGTVGWSLSPSSLRLKGHQQEVETDIVPQEREYI